MRGLLSIVVGVSVWAVSGVAHAFVCSIVSVSAVAFGSYNVFDSNHLDSIGMFTYRCDDVTPSDSIVIQLSSGSSSTFPTRTLTQGSYELDYNLYLDAARTTIWGDGTSGTSQYGPIVPADGSNVSLSVYGRIPAGQNARAGDYSDTVIVTVIF